MELGIFNLMGSRTPEKPTAEVFAEVVEQTQFADELGYAIAWFAEHHFSNYCLCASPLMMVAHCASITKKIRLGTAVVVLPLYNPALRAAEIATADALSNGRLMLCVGAGYQPYEFERFGVDIKANLEMTEEFCDILDRAFSQDFFSYNGKHYQIPKTHIPARPVQKPLPIYVAGHTEAMFRAAARHGYRVLSSGRVGGAALLAEQYQIIRDAYRVEGVPLENAHITVNRFCHITDSKEEGLRFAENARYQSRLASSLRRRQEVMQGTVLVDVPFPDEPPLEQIHSDLLIERAIEHLQAECGPSSQRTLCWRKPDSNDQSRSEKSGRSETRHIGSLVIGPAQAGTNPGKGTRSSNPASSSRQSVSRPHPLSSVENPGFPRGCARPAWRPGRQRRAGCFDIAPTGGNISVGPYSSTAVPLMGSARMPRCTQRSRAFSGFRPNFARF